MGDRSPRSRRSKGQTRALYDADKWSAVATFRFALRQARVDADRKTGSGLDAGETPSYAVLNLSAEIPLAAGLAVRLGAENVLDRAYANHLNRASLFDVDQVRVNEPGRSVWVKLSWNRTG